MKGGFMDTIHMLDVIPLLPLPYPPNGRSSYYVPCPNCDGNDKKKDKHLNINLVKDVFNCPKCGWNGGIFDLYAYYTNTPRYGIRDELIHILKGGYAQQFTNSIQMVLPKTVESPLAGIETRHAVYSALLSMLSLSPDHSRNLMARGLTEQAIRKNEYRTTLVIGEKALAKQLLKAGYSLAGVPGFFTDNNGQWSFVSNKRGILIPVRDIQGRIQGLQIRRDNTDKRKYRWVSSFEIKSGCGAEGWVHMAGSIKDRVILTEGPMKADIVHCLTGETVLAVPGVNSLKYVERTLTELVKLGVSRVMTAFDMDFLKNPYVQAGYTELMSLLGEMNLEIKTYLWSPDYNGLDDYIWEYKLNRSHDV